MTELEMKLRDYMRGAHHPQVNSVLVWEKGEMLAECYFNGFTPEKRNNIKSVVKSILSIAVGIARDAGLLELDDPIAKYIPEFAQGRDVRHKLIKVRHLLTMSTGIFWQGGVHYHCPKLDEMRLCDNWLDFIADCRVSDAPGSKYNYKEYDVMLLAVILSRVAGDCYDFIKDRLYNPLGIKSDRWFKSPDGIYYSVALDDDKEKWSDLCATDMLKLGILFLNDGIYDGKSIISKEYIDMAVSPSKLNPEYGFLWWIGDGWYGCRGYGGQSVTVFPADGRVVVTQARVTNRPLEYNDVISLCKK